MLWLWATRLSVDVLGGHERALRLVPLLGGLAVLVLGWQLARRLLPDVLVPIAVALMALSPALVYFSNEVKPYSVDVAVVLGLLLLALRVPRGEGPGHSVRVLAVAGTVAVWASFASVFVLAGLSVALVLGALRAGGLRRAVPTALVLSSWVLSLAVSYLAVLHRLADSTVLSGFWGYTFPDGARDLPAWLLRRAVDLTEDPLELFLWPLALLLLGIGAYRLWTHCRRPWLLASAAVPVAVVAAALSAYPFASRLALWVVPLAAVALAAVLPHHLERPLGVMAGAAALTLVAAPAAATSLQQTREVRYVEELRPVVEALKEARQPGDLVLVDIPAKAPFDYYTGLTGVGRDGVVLFATTEEVGGRCNDPAALLTGRFARQRVWVVFAHQLEDTGRLGTREDMLARIEDVTNQAQVIEAHEAKAVLFDPAAPQTAPSDEPRNPDRCLAVVRTVPPTGAS